MEVVFDLVRGIAGATFVSTGLIAIAGGCVGLWRLPDLYTRAHAWVVCAWGAASSVLGLAALAQDPVIAARLVLLAILIAGLGPTLAQFVANAAHAAGLAPLLGRSATSGTKGRGDA